MAQCFVARFGPGHRMVTDRYTGLEMAQNSQGKYVLYATDFTTAHGNWALASNTTAAGGQLFGSDSGILRITGPTTASFVTVVRIVRGTGEFAGATGGIVAPGQLDFVTGNTVGTYWGAVCGPDAD